MTSTAHGSGAGDATSLQSDPPRPSAQTRFFDVRRAISSLSLAQRTVIYFVYWEDLSERDIAALLDVSPGTVRRHLTRARAHLRKALT